MKLQLELGTETRGTANCELELVLVGVTAAQPLDNSQLGKLFSALAASAIW